LFFVFAGPTIALSAQVVNFMQIDIGEVATRTIDLINDFDVEATYQVSYFVIRKLYKD